MHHHAKKRVDTSPNLPSIAHVEIVQAGKRPMQRVITDIRPPRLHKGTKELYAVTAGIKRDMIAFGFTLTGRDDMEPNASPNVERQLAMKHLHAHGFRTWASIEPIVDLESSLDVIMHTLDYCDLN